MDVSGDTRGIPILSSVLLVEHARFDTKLAPALRNFEQKTRLRVGVFWRPLGFDILICTVDYYRDFPFSCFWT